MNQNEYNPQEIEKKWQQYWEENNTYKVENKVEGKENFYALSEFAYPSGNLHVGHWYAFAVPDIYARYKRMSGYNVLYPMGFDSFGLPAENAAIKRGLDPRKWTYENMDYMRNQLRSMGASFDWSRTLATSDPEYYKWTQWMFIKFYKNDLVYKDITKVNWDPVDKTILANEQVINGRSERSGAEVVQKDMAQWMLKITDFADELHDDLENLDWDHSIKAAQREWIGRKEGSLIPFKIQESEVYDVNTGPGDDAFREGEEIVDRDNVVVIIEHPEKDEFLCARWKQVDWQGFVTGGIEDGMSIEETALSEVREETGYQNPEIIKVYDQSSHGLFWHVVKQQNRRANYRIVHVKLKDLEQVARSPEEQAIADFLWIPRLEVNDFLKREDMRYPWRVVSANIQKFDDVKVFTTRADTLFGATYLVLAPEHDMVQNLKSQVNNWDEVETYLKEVEKKSDLDRQQSKEKTGVELKGIEAINPATGKPITVWIADYVLAHFGTGAVMAVPAHDERDAEFAIKYDLPFKFVCLPSAGEPGVSRPLITSGENAFIQSAGVTEKKGSQEEINAEWNAMYDFLAEVHDQGGVLPEGKRFCCTFEGKVINGNEEVNTKNSEEARRIITEMVGGEMAKTYRLRDWGISRQRYWGCPIPIVYDPEGNAHSIPKEHLPWVLPDDVDFTPDGTAPLARSKELKERTEKIFGVGWTPEVDTMDTFVDSSWYFYRYLDNQNDEQFASSESLNSWMPVNMYFGGAEHTTMHLLYSRFWVKALHKLGYVPDNEPYKGRLNRGLILGPDGAKMSKSKGNVIDPDEVVAHVGADTVRMYLAFIGPFNEPGNYPWDPNGVVGVRRFLDRVWRLQEKISDITPEELQSDLHQTIKKVGEDIQRLKLNTAISSMMTFVNKAEKSESISRSDYDLLIQILAPFAPHMCEDLWMQNNKSSIHTESFPIADESKISSNLKALPVQINGKVRAQIVVQEDEDNELLQGRVIALPEIQKWIEGKSIRKFIHVPGKIINLVVG
ncbi:MAG: class I tRNA ligase family protein [Candidatus Pacebacteria bacterium]|nr:class I tRNA ligase family protein [Candidatus Paceibacterota bacterium]